MAATQDSVSDEARDTRAESRPMSQLTIYNDDNNNGNGDGNINGGDPQASRGIVLGGGAGVGVCVGIHNTGTAGSGNNNNNSNQTTRPLILITDPNSGQHFARGSGVQDNSAGSRRERQHGELLAEEHQLERDREERELRQLGRQHQHFGRERQQQQYDVGHSEEQVEEVDGISYRIVAAVTKPPLVRTSSAGGQVGGASGSGVKRRQVGASASSSQAAILEQEGEESEENKWPAGVRSLSAMSVGSARPSAGLTPTAQQQQQLSLLKQQQQRQQASNKGGATSSSVAIVLDSAQTEATGRFSSVRRKSSAFVSNLLQAATSSGPQSRSSQDLGTRPRRMSIYEMTKSPPPETSLEIYLSERRRSSTVSSKQVQQQLEQQSTFETNYCQRQQYFKDLNQKLINHDKKLLNVVANRGQIHRHSVDIAQLPLHLAQAKASKSSAPASVSTSRARTPSSGQPVASGAGGKRKPPLPPPSVRAKQEQNRTKATVGADQDKSNLLSAIDQASAWVGGQRKQKRANKQREEDEDAQEEEEDADAYEEGRDGAQEDSYQATAGADERDDVYDDDEFETEVGTPFEFRRSSERKRGRRSTRLDRDGRLVEDDENDDAKEEDEEDDDRFGSRSEQRSAAKLVAILENKSLLEQQRGSITSSHRSRKKSRIVIRKFQKLDQSELSSGPAPDVKIGQRVAFKEYYGNEFGTIRWIGRVPQICPDWTVGVEFDNAIGEGDGSLNGRRYFIAKDCFAKFLPLNAVALVDQHVGRPEPGTMISVMSAAVRPGQMISIQRVSTVHVQHCFLNAPHCRPGADILAVNTRLHCQCPNCGPCAHVIKPPRTQRLARSKKNATHMCQFSTYTCCGMAGQEEAMCTYTGNKVVSLPPPITSSMTGLPPIGNSWIEGSGYLTNLQEQQSKLMPEEYRFGALPEDTDATVARLRLSRSSLKRGSGRHRRRKNQDSERKESVEPNNETPTQSPSPANETSAITGIQQQQTVSTGRYYGGSSFLHQNNTTTTPLSPSPDSNSTEIAVACQEKDSAKYVEPVWCESSVGSRIEQKSAKVIHRDSIENRYLFPTDEPIDSALEADLENLSQARYGHSTNTRLNGSRNIFKSLRSLVSCLGIQSDRSELEMHSENTFRYSDHGTNKGANKSMPAITSSAQVVDCCAQRHHQNSIPLKKDNFCAHNSFTAFNNKRQQGNFSEQAIRRHISSSSDCGFSSASQNSMNFQSYQACSPVMSIDDERRTNQVYKRIVARLMNTTTVSNEDLLRLRRALFEPHFENCCLHAINQTSFTSSVGTGEPPDQIIADIIQKSYLQQHDKRYEQIPRASSGYYHHATNHICSKSGLEPDKVDVNNSNYTSSDQQHNRNMIERSESAQSSTGIQRELPHGARSDFTHKPRSLIDGSLTSESMTLSSHDSICGTTAAIGGVDGESNASITTIDCKKKDKLKTDDSKSVDNANLPKAFELKLTLSINSDKKNTQIIEDLNEVEEHSSSVNDEIKGSSGNLMNSTFNINIVSTRKEDRVSGDGGEKNLRSASSNCLNDGQTNGLVNGRETTNDTASER